MDLALHSHKETKTGISIMEQDEDLRRIKEIFPETLTTSKGFPNAFFFSKSLKSQKCHINKISAQCYTLGA